MKKQTYILPKMETTVLPKDVLMEELILSSSSSMGKVGGSAPKRRTTEVF